MPSPPNDGEDRGASPVNLPSVGSYQGYGKRKVHTKKKKGIISANVAGTKYEIVRIVINEMDFLKTRDEDETANLIWNDSAVQHEKIAELRNYQRINHFPGMGEICRKDCLARNMSKMIKCQSQEYSFVPKTWIFPAEYTQFQNYVKEMRRKRKQKTFILKPANGAMGHGISLIRNCEKLPSQEHFIVQEYLDKPFLMEGYKFDLRIYILVTSCDPLRIFLYNDGLVRMGTEKYHAPSEANLSQLYMHLTNYSVNKHNENFERDETVDKGSKRSISWFTEFLRTNDYDVAKFWGDVSELVVKTLIVAEPHVLHAYRMCRPGQPPGSDSVCFEVLGFDIILDRKLKPWLLEINRAPSFGTDQKIDFDVKRGVLLNALKLLNIRASDKKRNLAQQKAEAQRRLYGHGSVKKLSAASSDWERQRHSLERRREELKERLAQVRKQICREAHEKQHLGNYRRIYPPDDKLLLEKYESLLSSAFQTFLAGRAASLQKEMNNPLKQMKEEDILDLLEQCELDDEKLMGKSSRQRGPKPLTTMAECSQTSRRQRPDYLADFNSGSSVENSCSSSNEEEEERRKTEGGGGSGEKREKKVSYDLGSKEKNLAERSGRMHWKPTVKPIKTSLAPSVSPTHSGPIRRSISCPRSIASLLSPNELRTPSSRPSPNVPVITTLIRPSSATLRSHSLSRSSSAYRVPHSNSLGTIHSNIGDPLINLRTKEQEAELVRQTLTALTAMRIRFPGKTEEEAEVVLDEILDNWKFHKPKVASYWLVKLDSTKQRKVLDIVRTNVRSALQRIWKEPELESLHLYRLFNRVFSRLLWSHGQGLWNCFSNSGSSWESIFSKSSEVVSPQERQCCRRLVQLCRDCLLVVYKFVSESRGSLTGLSPEWDDTRVPFAAGPASTHGSTSAAVAAASSSSVSSPPDAGTGTLLAGAVSLLCLGGRCHRKVLERYLLPVTTQFIIKWPSSSFGHASRAAPFLYGRFATGMGHF
ncbi:tubulin polyglutamylase TTLL7 isoform X1 [Hippocampus zosterae]|uniref:tubulin polyglutamylase TTLL7 isoform X1 n=2 Tax=Hippocampus zosterae TaxID=109293 RepID=UPI00223E3CCD|nr:tubulin polyglutamylase TTLL7 isoform X1 [Hippocampus zosterae]XP_051930472.1 tubulin polyglutamylase TTLL7 isoform X1 [Hippocampus zosterae]XP_051930473.1 tubulin polyglutamylase TTLL7 isoform X1 [Hippocampus zosterae]XP_051930474.1 tubulin polyglutamylase TTLL7 isoform X1 [Hippocampus zosterae]XP_051930475.1 tubulin polyglutamylase TTLL7 isoform X1 [Hippocampus zosterae]XP_051930476.1 tubulin polyglutamylase TTLL7 isoform X1 [Hippocampus zosterae]XP_051930477.1 tubulin polyglutamylase TT